MQTRRQFVAAAGTAAAAAILAPEALGQGRAAPLARGGRFAEGVMSGEPTPGGITLWTRLGDVGGRSRPSSRSRATATSAASSRAGA